MVENQRRTARDAAELARVVVVRLVVQQPVNGQALGPAPTVRGSEAHSSPSVSWGAS